MAEHPAVNRRVAGSSPARGATPIKPTKSASCEDRLCQVIYLPTIQYVVAAQAEIGTDSLQKTVDLHACESLRREAFEKTLEGRNASGRGPNRDYPKPYHSQDSGYVPRLASSHTRAKSRPAFGRNTPAPR